MHLLVLAIDLLKIKKPLVSSFLHLNNFNLLESFLVDLQALKFVTDFSQSGVESLLLFVGFVECLLHLGHFLIELDGAADFFQDCQEAALTLDH